MSSKKPAIGETWELGDQYGRSTRGIVAEITDTRVMLVALTGARINVPASRFPEQWLFVTAAPQTEIRCSRCKDYGILQYQRGVSPDFVCPKHLPIGVLASMHTLGIAVEQPKQAPRDVIRCPECGSADPVEDVRLGRLERGGFGWWTCPLCSSRWGLIAEAPSDTDDKGRWYADTVAELQETMSDELTSIELSKMAWYAISFSGLLELKDEVGVLHGVPSCLVPSLTEGSVLIRAKRAPPGSAMGRSSIRKPVQRIGGVGNRSGATDGSAAAPYTAVTEAVVPTPVATLPEKLPPVELKPPAWFNQEKLPVDGSHYFQRQTGKEVEVVRVEEIDGRVAVALRDTSHTSIGSSPYILWWNDFQAEYVKAGKPPTSPVPEPMPHPTVKLNVNEEWFSFEYNEYVTVISVDLRKMTAVVRGGSTGRTRNAKFDDFADKQKYYRVVLLTAHQRLMMEDD